MHHRYWQLMAVAIVASLVFMHGCGDQSTDQAESASAIAARAEDRAAQKLTEAINQSYDWHIREARYEIEKGRLQGAIEFLEKAIALEGVTRAKDEARVLLTEVQRVSTYTPTVEAIVELPANEYVGLITRGVFPDSFHTSGEHLNTVMAERVVGFVTEHLEAIQAARQERDEKEAARIAEEQERLRLARIVEQGKSRLAAERAQQEKIERDRELERQTRQALLASVDLVLESWSWHEEYGYAVAEGEVTNVSGHKIENIEVVATFRQSDGTLITSDSALIAYTSLMPGQTSTFKVYATWNPRMKRAGLEFRHFWGNQINCVTRDQYREMQSGTH